MHCVGAICDPDEADRKLSDGFEKDVERIPKTSPSERHRLLFSATMPT